MLNEIKLYLLTKHLVALYGNKDKVIKELEHLLGLDELHPDFWEYWMRRFADLDESKEAQIIMLREAGMPYRKIREILGVSPNTIQRVLGNFTLNYGELEGIMLLKEGLNTIGQRLKLVGNELW